MIRSMVFTTIVSICMLNYVLLVVKLNDFFKFAHYKRTIINKSLVILTTYGLIAWLMHSQLRFMLTLANYLYHFNFKVI